MGGVDDGGDGIERMVLLVLVRWVRRVCLVMPVMVGVVLREWCC